MPQMTALPPPQQTNAFGLQPPQQQQHQPFSSFLQPQGTGLMQPQVQPQATGFLQPQMQPTGFLQPQATGSNPFRQSMMMPQMTGIQASSFLGASDQQSFFQPQGQTQGPGQVGPLPFAPGPFHNPSASATASTFSASPFSQNPVIHTAADLPARPASTPLTAFGSSSQPTTKSPPEAQPVKTHQTGSRNPFGIPEAPAPPPVPKAPTLMELYLNGGNTVNSSPAGQLTGQQQQTPQQTGPFNGSSAFGAFGGGEGKGDMASVASSFAFASKANENKTGTSGLPSPSGAFPFLNSQNTSTTVSGSGFSDSIFSSLSSQPTGATTLSNGTTPSISLSPTLKPQMTGFSGLKPFKPSSSFGASLLESLPPIPGSNPNTPGNESGTSSPSAPGGMPSLSATSSFGAQLNGLGVLKSQPTGATSLGGFGGGSNLGSGLRPQMTGGAANPFRATTFTNAGNGGATGAFSSSASSPSGFNASGNFGVPSSNGTPFGAFGGAAFGAGFNPNGGTQEPSKQTQQNGTASLI